MMYSISRKTQFCKLRSNRSKKLYSLSAQKPREFLQLWNLLVS